MAQVRSLKLLLLRHAEAEEAHGQKDRARTLTRRGAKDAARLGEMLAGEGFRPALILTSDAVRATETAQAIATALGLKEAVQIDTRLYLGGLTDLGAALGALAEGAETVLVVGHNPGFSLSVLTLTEVPVELGTAEGGEMTTLAEDWASAMRLQGAWELVRVVKG